MTADSGLIFIAITPCRAVDTRYPGGAFGTPSLVANTPRIFPVPASNCGVPVAAAYSMNFVSITPAGQAVGFVAAWQDDRPWPGTVVLNALQGGIVDNSAIVPAGADGGIQVMATANCDLVIDLNGYYADWESSGISGAAGSSGTARAGRSNGRARTVWSGGSGWADGSSRARGSPRACGGAGACGPVGPVGAQGLPGPAGAGGPPGRLWHLKAHGILPRRMRPVTLYLKTDPATSRLKRTP
ncbi:MAG TPA: hypothetical protein VEV85_08420 [Bryobacteraceae bacterium]|nr:hypothetical protein [Bryobacteraceae bacterium]